MTALIRAIGSKQIGMGHLNRAALVADAFQKQKTAAQIVIKANADAEHFLKARNAPFVTLDEKMPFAAELEKLNELLSGSSSLFVLDSLEYENYYDYLKSLKAKRIPTAVVWDQTERKEIPADVTLNGNPLQLKHDYRDFAGRYLVGPKYFLMDTKYKDSVTLAPRKPIKTVLVTVGGSDHNDLLFKLIDALESVGMHIHAKIFSTSTTGYLDRLKKRLSSSPLSHELFLDETSLVGFWAGCDAAITAAGNTLFERIATRLPGATLCQLDLQVKIAEAFEAMGVSRNLGDGRTITKEALVANIKAFLDDFELQQKQYVKSTELIDGRGLDYFMEAINELRRS